MSKGNRVGICGTLPVAALTSVLLHTHPSVALAQLIGLISTPNNEIVEVNPEIGWLRFVATLGDEFSWEFRIAAHQGAHRLYAAYEDCPPDVSACASYLDTIDTQTGAQVGRVPLSGRLDHLAFDRIRLIGVTHSDHTAVVVDPSSGSLSLIATLGDEFSEEFRIAVDPSAHRLYAAYEDCPPDVSGCVNYLETVDLQTRAQVGKAMLSSRLRLLTFGGSQSSSRVGDCGDDGQVSIDELLTMVNIALGDASVGACEVGDVNHDRLITIDEILTAVNNALNGCASVPTPTPTPCDGGALPLCHAGTFVHCDPDPCGPCGCAPCSPCPAGHVFSGCPSAFCVCVCAAPQGSIVAESTRGAPNTTVGVPLTAILEAGVDLTFFGFDVSVAPVGLAPPLTSPISFVPAAALPAPFSISPGAGSNTLEIVWRNKFHPFAPPLNGTIELGVLNVPVPATASSDAPGDQYQVTVAILDTNLPLAAGNGIIDTSCTLTFSGRVTDTSTGAAIAGASVCLNPSPCVRTADNGICRGLCYPGQSSAATYLCATANGYGTTP